MRRGLISVLVISLFVIGATLGSAAQSGSADLKVTGSGSSGSGLSVQYSAAIKNKGPDAATGVVISGGISGGSISSVGSDHGPCTISGDSFTCNIGTLASGETAGLQMSGFTPNFGPHPNQITYCGGHVSATASTSDPNTANNAVGICVVIPGNGCSNPQGCGQTCQPGFFWCAASNSCVPVSGHCP
jgi:Domain of unknown function DUF11